MKCQCHLYRIKNQSMLLPNTVKRITKMNSVFARSLRLPRNYGPSRITTIRFLSSKTDDIQIHTGQKWNSDDYRLVRFTNSPKIVNQNWAVNLIAEVPPKEVTERVVWCDGGSGPEGHPRVYINLDKPGNHSCGYCGLRFIKKDHH